MRSKKTGLKTDFYLTIINKLKEGKTTTTISKELNISKQALSYYTAKLKRFGFIEKKGYGVWEVKRSKKNDLEHTLSSEGKKIRGHAFIWRVKPENTYNWINLLEDRKIPYKLVRGQIPRILIRDQKVWLTKNTIIVYDNRSFYGKNALESRKYAVNGLLETLRELSNKLGVKLGKPIFKPTREHFGMIKNELARQCNSKGEKISINDTLDGEWLWVDDSTGMLGELETGGKGIKQDRANLNKKVQDWYNDHKKYNFEVTPTYLLNSINQVTENQKMFAANLQSHIEAIQTLSQTVKELKEEIHRLKWK